MDAIIWYDNLLKQMHWQGAQPSITEQGLKDIQTLLNVKTVGRYDPLMNDDQVTELKSQKCKTNDVAEVITSWFVRTTEALKFEVPPDEIELDKSMYQLVLQIFKILRVEMDTATVKETE